MTNGTRPMTMRSKIIQKAGWNRANAGAMAKAHAMSKQDVDGIEWADVPDDAVLFGETTVWLSGGRLLAGVWTGASWVTRPDGTGAVRDITTAIHRVP